MEVRHRVNWLSSTFEPLHQPHTGYWPGDTSHRARVFPDMWYPKCVNKQTNKSYSMRFQKRRIVCECVKSKCWRHILYIFIYMPMCQTMWTLIGISDIKTKTHTQTNTPPLSHLASGVCIVLIRLGNYFQTWHIYTVCRANCISAVCWSDI